MEQTPSSELQKIFNIYATVIRPRIEDHHKKVGIKLEENIISECNNSKEDGRPSGSPTISNHK